MKHFVFLSFLMLFTSCKQKESSTGTASSLEKEHVIMEKNTKGQSTVVAYRNEGGQSNQLWKVYWYDSGNPMSAHQEVDGVWHGFSFRWGDYSDAIEVAEWSNGRPKNGLFWVSGPIRVRDRTIQNTPIVPIQDLRYYIQEVDNFSKVGIAKVSCSTTIRGFLEENERFLTELVKLESILKQ